MKIIGVIGTILILLGLVVDKKSKLHLIHFIACMFLTAYAILIHDVIFSVMNVILLGVNGIQYFKEKKRGN